MGHKTQTVLVFLLALVLAGCTSTLKVEHVGIDEASRALRALTADAGPTQDEVQQTAATQQDTEEDCAEQALATSVRVMSDDIEGLEEAVAKVQQQVYKAPSLSDEDVDRLAREVAGQYRLSDEDVERIAVAVSAKLRADLDTLSKSVEPAKAEGPEYTVDMWTDTFCAPCVYFDSNSWGDTYPTGVLNKINYTANSDSAKLLNVTKLPTFILRNRDGVEIWRGLGPMKWSEVLEKSGVRQDLSKGEDGGAPRIPNYYHLRDQHGIPEYRLDSMTDEQIEALHNSLHPVRSTPNYTIKGNNRRRVLTWTK
jgi:hypothetical protein